MKKAILLIIFLFCISLSSKAQNTTFNNVAIGIDSPAFGTQIKTNLPGYTGTWGRAYFITNETGSQSFFAIGSIGYSTNGVSSVSSNFIGKDLNTKYMTFLPDGNIGIGTDNPLSNLHIKGSSAILRLESPIVTQNASVQFVSNNQLRWELGTGIQTGANFELFDRINSKSSLVVNPEGNVGIGTINPTAKLTVAGSINSREVKVTVDAGADFVFEKDYDLPSLDSVHQYIKENKHLPEIASAEEMKKDGINLSEMNIKLLQKIEEMTLYMIEQNKQIKSQNERIQTQDEKIINLDKKLNQILIIK